MDEPMDMPPLEGDPDAPTGPPDDEDREVEEVPAWANKSTQGNSFNHCDVVSRLVGCLQIPLMNT